MCCGTTGQIQAAIACQEQARQTARHCLQRLTATAKPEHPTAKHQAYYLRMLEIDSLLSLGLYYIDLWDLETAAELLSQVIALGREH